MLFEEFPSELLLEIFSYLHPSDLYLSFVPLINSRLSNLISELNISIDLTQISYSNFLLIFKLCVPSKIIYLRLTNQYSHGLLIKEFFSQNLFTPDKFLRLHSLYLDDFIGNEIHFLPPYLKKLYIKFHKKSKYAAKFYQTVLQSTTLKQCYLIGGYAFDYKTCTNISSTTIEVLHMAIKTFPNDLIVLLKSLPNLTKLKTRVYSQSSEMFYSSSFTSSLTHLNIDLGHEITLTQLDSHILSHLPRLKSLIYHSSKKSTDDINNLVKLSNKLKRIQFIRKDLSIHHNILNEDFNDDLIATIQEINNTKNIRQLLTLHTIPYPDKILYLPFIQWDRIRKLNDISNEEIYDRVEHIRLNLSKLNISSNFPICRHVKYLTLTSNNDSNNCILSSQEISSFICLSSIRHLIINTSKPLLNLNELFSLMSLNSLDISWSQIYPYLQYLSNIKNLSLISECLSWKEIQYLLQNFIPNLEHLQLNVTTSDECQKILNILLSPIYTNKLISIKICICQTLSDQIQDDLEPLFLSNQWLKVKYRMDNWYLYIWK